MHADRVRPDAMRCDNMLPDTSWVADRIQADSMLPQVDSVRTAHLVSFGIF